MVDFLMVDYLILYKILMGRLFFKKAQVVESIHYKKMKFKIDKGIRVVKGNQNET